MMKNQGDTTPSEDKDGRIRVMCEAMAQAAHVSALEQGVEIATITMIVLALDETGRPVLTINSTGYETPADMIEATMAQLIESAATAGLLPSLFTTEPPNENPPAGGFTI